MSTNPNDSVQYLCSRCGHAESDHPTHKCIGFAFEADKILGGIYMSDKERAQRLEAMIDRMSETIVELRRQLFFAREEAQKYHASITEKDALIFSFSHQNYKMSRDKALLTKRIVELEAMITRRA